MKKLILITGLVFVFMHMKSQGNLQFNQVKIFTGSVPNYSVSENYVVPNGKVWKIEYFISPNGIIINDASLNPGNGISGFSFQNPVWLGQGDRLKAANWNNSNSGYMISIIEFNVIP